MRLLTTEVYLSQFLRRQWTIWRLCVPYASELEIHAKRGAHDDHHAKHRLHSCNHRIHNKFLVPGFVFLRRFHGVFDPGPQCGIHSVVQGGLQSCVVCRYRITGYYLVIFSHRSWAFETIKWDSRRSCWVWPSKKLLSGTIEEAVKWDNRRSC